MQGEQIYTLVPSSTNGRYALDHQDGPDLTSGDRIAILLGGHWIKGHVERASLVYAIDGYTGGMGVKSGYIFYADDGTRCGLCDGMTVAHV